MSGGGYNDPAHLQAFQASGRFPPIHSSLFELIVAESMGSCVVEIGAHYGLLAQRLARLFGGRVEAVEPDAEAVAAAKANGVSVPLHVFPIDREHLPRFFELIRSGPADILVARRCISEVFARDQSWAPDFARGIAEAGIREVFLQGREVRRNSTHPIPTVEHEARLFEPSFRVALKRGELARLVRR